MSMDTHTYICICIKYFLLFSFTSVFICSASRMSVKPLCLLWVGYCMQKMIVVGFWSCHVHSLMGSQAGVKYKQIKVRLIVFEIGA